MRTFTVTHEVYTFDELSEDARQKALEELYDINVDSDWWYENIYEDAENIGLKITSFDTYKHDISGHLTEDMQTVCKNILKEHDNTCATYTTAEKNKNRHGEDNQQQFCKDLLEVYLVMLRDNYEYLQSEEAITETIRANEYEFYANGKLAS